MKSEYKYRSINKGSVVDTMKYSFTVTQNCNLACKYCYECKNDSSTMNLETAKRAVDFALNYGTHLSAVRFDFMGGEPLLEINMIDRVMDYIKFRLYEEKHKWFGRTTFNLTTNGILYDSDPVQKFVKKNINSLNVSLTIDGIKEKHDMNRIFKNGEGSFDSVVKNVPLWLSQFPNAGTKVTFASADLKYLKESIIYLNSLGIKEIVATLVNEDVWKEGDETIYEEQLNQLADYMVENNHSVEFAGGQFTDTTGLPYDSNRLKLNWCNCGENNFEIDYRGYLYPCVRFLPFALSNKEDRFVGHIDRGVDYNKLRPFEALTFANQSSNECLACPVASGCGWCVGNNYNQDAHNTVFGRETAICKMHKARSRANDYYWAKMKSKKGIIRKIPNIDRKRFLYIMISDNSVDYCTRVNYQKSEINLSFENFQKGLNFARLNAYTPVVVYDENNLDARYEKELENYEALRIKPASLIQEGNNSDSIIILDTKDVANLEDGKTFIQVILHIQKADIPILSAICNKLFTCARKISLLIDDWKDMKKEDIDSYHQALRDISDIIVEYAKHKKIVQLNVLTDIMITTNKMNCGAGYSSILLSPDGELYPCPSFYRSNKYKSIGNLDCGFTDDISVYKMNDSPVCSHCDISSCRMCVFNNIEETAEYKIPTLEQCRMKNIEKAVSFDLQKKLILIDNNTPFQHNMLQEQDYADTLDFMLHEKYSQYR